MKNIIVFHLLIPKGASPQVLPKAGLLFCLKGLLQQDLVLKAMVQPTFIYFFNTIF